MLNSGFVVVEDVRQVLKEHGRLLDLIIDPPWRWPPQVQHAAPIGIVCYFWLAGHELDALGNDKCAVVSVIVVLRFVVLGEDLLQVEDTRASFGPPVS